MGQALYRDYRPKKFDDVVGQDHITATLKNAIKSGRISHAYLFTGPHGVGKTSIARILAHEVNGLPYDSEKMHLDIIEIDAASNNGVEDVRELREKAHISPTSAKYKVYIIDEVHMLSKSAFNALLKILEEPPAHVIFILATTEAHKLPQTIISRTQRFEFKPIVKTDASKHLTQIASKEGMKITPEALELLAEHGSGSFRDSISLLDQIGTVGASIGEPEVRQFLGLPPSNLIDNLMNEVENGDTAGALTTLDELRQQGANPSTIARLIAAKLRKNLISGANEAWRTALLRQLIEVPASHRPHDSLEISVLEACVAVQPGVKVASLSAAAPQAPTVELKEKSEPEEKIVEEPEPSKPAAAAPAETRNFDEQVWEEIVERVKKQAASLYTALRLATPEQTDGKLVLAFQFPLHKKKIDIAENNELVAKIASEVTGQNLAIEAVVDKTKKAKTEEKPAKEVGPKAVVSTPESISNIFPAAEVLES